MTKAELLKKVSKETGIETVILKAIFESIVSNIKSTLASGEPLFIRGFGTFLPKVRKTKTARLIKANTTLIVPEHTVPVFKPSPDFKKLFH